MPAGESMDGRGSATHGAVAEFVPVFASLWREVAGAHLYILLNLTREER